VFRIEKRGVGDSENHPTSLADFNDELQDFIAGLNAIFENPHIDPTRVALLGHSLGALHAPVLAERDPRVSAVALYGAGIRPWNEYVIDNARRQCALANASVAVTERVVDMQARLWDSVLIDGRGVEETLIRYPDLHEERAVLGIDGPERLYGRSTRYWRGVQEADAVRPLQVANVTSLIMWGSNDWVTSLDENKDLAEATGAKLEVIEGADHGFFSHASPVDSFTSQWAGEFHPEVATCLGRWLKDTMG
jgi:uncharacterized protein